MLALDASATDTGWVLNTSWTDAVTIGEACFVGPPAGIWALQSIAIGDRGFVSHGVHIFDNNSHSLSVSELHVRFQELQRHECHLMPEAVVSRFVRIENDVWIGFNATILKGVTIGRGAVIAAECFATEDASRYAIVAGNPARVMGESRP
jgi:acetyltransferase-like isoleucine patch superfamily enzyme